MSDAGRSGQSTRSVGLHHTFTFFSPAASLRLGREALGLRLNPLILCSPLVFTGLAKTRRLKGAPCRLMFRPDDVLTWLLSVGKSVSIMEDRHR